MRHSNGSPADAANESRADMERAVARYAASLGAGYEWAVVALIPRPGVAAEPVAEVVDLRPLRPA